MKKNTYWKPQKSKKKVSLRGKQGGRSVVPTVLTDQELRVAGAFLPDLHRYPESHAHLHDLCLSMDEGVKQIKQGGVYALGLPSSWGGIYSWAKQRYIDPVPKNVSYLEQATNAASSGLTSLGQMIGVVPKDVSYFEQATNAASSGLTSLGQSISSGLQSLNLYKPPQELSLFQKATNYAWSWMAPYVEGASSYFASLVSTVSGLSLGSILAYLTAGAIMAAAALYFYRKFKGKLTENDRKVGNVRSKLQNAIETWRKVSEQAKLYYIVDTTFESNWQKISRDLRQWDSFFASSNLSDSSLLSEEEAATWLSKIAAVQSASEALLQQIQDKAKPKPALIAPKIKSPTALYNVVVPSVSDSRYERIERKNEEEEEENAMLRNYLPPSAPTLTPSSVSPVSVGSISTASVGSFQPPPVDVQSSLSGTNQRVSELQQQRLELERQLKEKQAELDLQIKRSKDLRYFEAQEKEYAVAQQPRMGGSRRGRNG
jgi:hypothetical protein